MRSFVGAMTPSYRKPGTMSGFLEVRVPGVGMQEVNRPIWRVALQVSVYLSNVYSSSLPICERDEMSACGLSDFCSYVLHSRALVAFPFDVLVASAPVGPVRHHAAMDTLCLLTW